MSLSPSQCRAARALLDWSQYDLAEVSHVATKTLADFERGKRTPYARTLADVRAALEGAGVEFIAENGGGLGVRLKAASQSEPAAKVVEQMDEAIAKDLQSRNPKG